MCIKPITEEALHCLITYLKHTNIDASLGQALDRFTDLLKLLCSGTHVECWRHVPATIHKRSSPREALRDNCLLPPGPGREGPFQRTHERKQATTLSIQGRSQIQEMNNSLDASMGRGLDASMGFYRRIETGEGGCSWSGQNHGQ